MCIKIVSLDQKDLELFTELGVKAVDPEDDWEFDEGHLYIDMTGGEADIPVHSSQIVDIIDIAQCVHNRGLPQTPDSYCRVVNEMGALFFK